MVTEIGKNVPFRPENRGTRGLYKNRSRCGS